MARTRNASATATLIADAEATRHTLIAAYLAACDAYQTAADAFEGQKVSVSKAAADLVRPCTTHDLLIATRDAFKADFIARRDTSTDDLKKKATDAANMAWSRVIARAKQEKVAIPEPVQSDEAKAQQAKREAAKAARRTKAFEAAKAAGATDAVANAMADQAVDARKQKTAAKPGTLAVDVSDDALAIARILDADDDLFDAFEYVTSDASHRTIFLKWAEAQMRASRKAA